MAASTSKKPATRPATKPAAAGGAAKAAVKTAVKPAAKAAPAAQKPAATPPARAARTKPATGALRTGKAPKAAAKAEKETRKKTRLVRDSFTMPEATYEIFGAIKKRCLARGLAVKKSEILRAALAAFDSLGDAAIGRAIGELESIRTGRPPKSAK